MMEAQRLDSKRRSRTSRIGINRSLEATVKRYELNDYEDTREHGDVEILAQTTVGPYTYGLLRWRTDRERLTKRETDVARLAADGLTNKEIAAKLDVSPFTVASHMQRVFSKLGVSTRAGIGIQAVFFSSSRSPRSLRHDRDSL